MIISLFSFFNKVSQSFIYIYIRLSILIITFCINFRENKLDHKIELVKGRLEDTELPIDKVDIIVSEWMGYFLLFEAMLDSVVYARDHHLSPGGILMPNRCSISLVGVSDMSKYISLRN